MKLVSRTSVGLSIAIIFLAGYSRATVPVFYNMEIVPTPTDGGIRFDIPDRFKGRFEKWKAELLSTHIGREQWERYENNKQFLLTIRVDKEKGKGAGTDKFQWDADGRFVGATITLGPDIDAGYPSPIYYPVLNSLSDDRIAKKEMSGVLLAATKLSHEIGHVAQTEDVKFSIIKKQIKLIPEYTEIFLNNGFNSQDERLLELKDEIGGTPIEVWESREYWSEVTAMHFLREKIRDEDFYCNVLARIRENVATYARDYGKRFDIEANGCKN